MIPLDRIAQLTAQLADAREQAARDSATIARLAGERDLYVKCVNESESVTERGNLVGEIQSLRSKSDKLLDELANQVNRWEAMLEHAERLEDTGMAYSCRNALHHARQALAKTEGVTA